MINSILQIISGLLMAAGKLYDIFYSWKLIEAGKNQEQLSSLQREVQNAKIADEARETVRADIVKHPDRIVPDNDPFLRD